MSGLKIYVIEDSNNEYKTISQQYKFISLSPHTINMNDFFKYQTSCNTIFTDINGKTPKSIDNIATITLSFKFIYANESFIKQKIKDKTSYSIKKRMDEINSLENDRDSLNKKIVDINALENTIKEHYKEIEIINEQIRNHYKEIENIKLSLTRQIEVGDETDTYSISINRNQIYHINGLVYQTKKFSLMWFTDKDTDGITEPAETAIKNVKSIKISYEKLLE